MATFTVFPQFKLRQHNGNAIDLDTDDIRYFIVTNTYVPNNAHDFVDDLTNHVTGTGAPGTSGVAVANKTLALDGTTLEFGFDDISIAQNAAGFADGRHLIVAKWTGSAATSGLIGYASHTGDFGNVAGQLDFDITQTNGILQQ